MNDLETKSLAKIIALKLKVERKNGTVTPASPITGDELAKGYNKKFHATIRNKEIQAAVSYARAVLHLPLGSDTRGYWY